MKREKVRGGEAKAEKCPDHGLYVRDWFMLHLSLLSQWNNSRSIYLPQEDVVVYELAVTAIEEKRKWWPGYINLFPGKSKEILQWCNYTHETDKTGHNSQMATCSILSIDWTSFQVLTLHAALYDKKATFGLQTLSSFPIGAQQTLVTATL